MTSLKTLLDADYVTRDGKAVVRLFYKDGGERTISEVTDFEPYFYAIPKEDSDALASKIRKLENVIRVEGKKMVELGREIDVLMITVRQPSDVPTLREEVNGILECFEVREADIPFARRYIIDSGIVPMEHTDGITLNVAAVDLEVYNKRGEPNSKKDPIIMVSYADTLGKKSVFTYGDHGKVKLDYLEFLDSEKAIIERLIETIVKQNIDVLVGYNSDNFDFPYLRDRGGEVGVGLNLGMDGSEVKFERRGMNLGAKVRGRPHIDVYPTCRQVFNLPRYRLEDVYLSMFGEEKKDIKSGDIHKYWDSNDPEKLRTLAEYSMSDATATLAIAERLLPLQYELSRLIRTPVYETSRMGSGQRVEQLLIEHAREKNIIVPNRPSDRIVHERQTGSYIGAYVVEPVRGIHDNIILFDFRSLYPSIIISHNIDPSTIDCDCCRDTGYKSPTGHWFCKKKKGFIPEVLERLIDLRVKVKEKIAKEADPSKRNMLEIQQQALKLLANSMYGYYGFPRARWYSRECAEAIAAWGRDYIQKTIRKAEEMGFKVVYGDTDSVFITKAGEKERKEVVRRAREFADEINRELPESMELEFEGYYPRGIFITKKRYALIDENKKLTVKGLETRRRDWADIAKDTQEKVLAAILEEKNPDKAARIVKEVVDGIKRGDVKLEDLAINTQITRNIRDYVATGPHIAAVKKAMKEGMEFKQGNIITYVITRKGSSISDRARIVDFVEEGDYDPEYYISNQVLPAVMRILEALGYSEDELRGLGKQTTLGSFK